MLLSREIIQMYRDAIAAGEPIGFALNELLSILDMALAVDDAAEVLAYVAAKDRTKAVRERAVECLKKLKADPQAPCTADEPGVSPELASHKDAATPASSDGHSLSDADPPGKSTGDSRLPAKPAGTSLSRDERTCANRLATAAGLMVKTFKDHLDVCGPCAINWQTLRKALGQWESVTK